MGKKKLKNKKRHLEGAAQQADRLAKKIAQEQQHRATVLSDTSHDEDDEDPGMKTKASRPAVIM